MCAKDVTEGQQLVESIRTSFLKWNKDKRAIDWKGLDGDGKDPTQWDFRLSALMRTPKVV